MSHSKETENLELPIFEPTDKPAWLGDWNEAMTKLDTVSSNSDAKFNELTTRIDTQDQKITTITADTNIALTRATEAQSQITTELIPRFEGDEKAINEHTTKIAANTTAIASNATAIASMQNQIACCELASSSDSATIEGKEGVFVLIPFDKLTTTQDGVFSYSSNAIVCNFDGYALVGAGLTTLNNDAASITTLQIWQNDEWINEARAIAAETHKQAEPEVSPRLIKVNSGDRFTLKARVQSGGTIYYSHKTSHITIQRVK